MRLIISPVTVVIVIDCGRDDGVDGVDEAIHMVYGGEKNMNDIRPDLARNRFSGELGLG